MGYTRLGQQVRGHRSSISVPRSAAMRVGIGGDVGGLVVSGASTVRQ